jgi:hypothetical protein
VLAPHVVDFVHVVFGAGQTVDEPAVVREQHGQ